MDLLLPALLLPGIKGWMLWGPPPDPDQRIALDPRRCVAEVWARGLRGGAAAPDLQLGLIWDGRAWVWAEDWKVEAGKLLRPGFTPVPLEASGLTVTVDSLGQVVSYTNHLGTTHILRENGFSGVERNGMRLELGPDELRSSDGRHLALSWAGPRLTQLGERHFSYRRDGQLSAIEGPEGQSTFSYTEAGLRLSHPQGEWGCTLGPAGSELSGPGGPYKLRQDGEDWNVSQANGFRAVILREKGRISGWIDPKGGQVHLQRDSSGRITGLQDAAGQNWRFSWEGSQLKQLKRGDGAVWRAGEGMVSDPVGRNWPFQAGESHLWHWGQWNIRLDAQGRWSTVSDAMGRKIELFRDPAGLLSGLSFGGGKWLIARESDGQISTIYDPTGAKWFITWAEGRPQKLRLPDGQEIQLRWEKGRLIELQQRGQHWEFQWTPTGLLSQIRPPLGAACAFPRDELGRLQGIGRPDGHILSVQSDATGDLVGVEGLSLSRDANGRPTGLSIPGFGHLSWIRDGQGRVRGVEAPGLGLGLDWDAADTLSAINTEQEIAITRNNQAQIIQAGQSQLQRDASGLITLWASAGQEMTLLHDDRGWETGIKAKGELWSLRRDAVGRVLQIVRPEGALGIGRSSGGLPNLLRLPNLGVWHIDPQGPTVRLTGEDIEGRPLQAAGWSLDALDRVEATFGAQPLRFSYDPAGGLAGIESATQGWMADSGGQDRPGGRLVLKEGRPDHLEGAWPIHYQTGQGGRIDSLETPEGPWRFAYDSAGRLSAWQGPEGLVTVERDAFGRLQRVGTTAVWGWDRLWGIGELGWLHAPGIAWSMGEIAAILDPNGRALEGGWAEGPLDSHERPLIGMYLGLQQSREPWGGWPLGAAPQWPWQPPSLDAGGGADSPVPGVDQAGAAPWWAVAPWASQNDWGDALEMLVIMGELPITPAIPDIETGIPWISDTLTDRPPAPFRRRSLSREDALGFWLIQHVPLADLPEMALPQALLSNFFRTDISNIPGIERFLPEVLSPSSENSQTTDLAWLWGFN